MTSLQKLSQQLALTSRNSKFRSHHFVSSWLLATPARHGAFFELPTSQFSSRAQCDSRIANTSRSDEIDKRSKLSPFASRWSSSVIECPSNEIFVQDSDDKVKSRQQVWEGILEETSYFFHGGLRHVYPYHHTYHVHVKGRWVGCTIEDAFKTTYYAVYDENWIERDILNGSLTINHSRTSKDYILKRTDKIQHTVHRHELPVLDAKIDILHQDSNIVVVNKPPSIPIHPTGRYQHNSMLYILVREHQMYDAHVIHRLDMGTSGILLLGRNKSAATFYSVQNMQRKTEKTYVARVVGEFPEGIIHCEEALGPIDLKTRIMKVCSSGKPSSTTFETLGYDPVTNTSVVLCKPHTGRTHQIRVHLQFLGHPIHNDPLYNNPMFGPDKAKGGSYTRTPQEIIKCWESNRSRWNRPWDVKPGDIVYEPWSVMAQGPVPCHSKVTVDNSCEICPLHLIVNREDLGFHLHALEYRGSEGDWCFSTPLPDWAYLDWNGSCSQVY